MTTLNEGAAALECILSEANGHRSREVITIISGAGVVVPGTVLGKITASGKYKASAIGASDGSEVAIAVALAGVDATSADKSCLVLARDAEINKNLLTYHADRDQPAEKVSAQTNLATVGIIAR